MFFEEKRSQVVPAMLKGLKNADDKGTIDEISSVSARPNAKRKGISLGPVEIISGSRRGASVGPAKIFGAARSRQMLWRPEMSTPVQSWRKSCYWKLQGITEEKASSGKGFSSVAQSGPKKLFREYVANHKKLWRPERNVASRYNNLNSGQIPSVGNGSLPEKDDG
ncbi:Unknown protein [Striga hermonthica]|uniref:Uncharacterized protein n=1 Tax=Striga hermonthica TaxID=68872 RepID=A0A9N7R0Y3_STRHE|nr:Unknown protein [Striga hermonthica]